MPPKDPFQHHTKISFFLFQSFNQITHLDWKFTITMVMTIRIVFWDVTPHCFMDNYHCCGGTCCLHPIWMHSEHSTTSCICTPDYTRTAYVPDKNPLNLKHECQPWDQYRQAVTCTYVEDFGPAWIVTLDVTVAPSWAPEQVVGARRTSTVHYENAPLHSLWSPQWCGF